MKDLIIKTLKEHSTYLDRSRSYEGIYDEQFDYVADALIKQFAISSVGKSFYCFSEAVGDLICEEQCLGCNTMEKN
ncbi:hypothetical protein N9Q05_02020 [bacterium]|nr:hypothetical protein [bacterium]